MKFEFTENAALEGDRKWGGDVAIVMESMEDAKAVAKHYKLYADDPIVLAEWLVDVANNAPVRYYPKAGREHAWYEIESALDHEFTKPYFDQMHKMTGADENLFYDLELTHPDPLDHRYLVQSVGLQHGHFIYKVLDSAQPWNKKSAQEYADSLVQDYMEEELGARQSEPEFIQLGNGQYTKNPNYLKRHRPKPALTCPWLWSALWDHWYANHATAAQRDALARNRTLGKYANDVESQYGRGPSYQGLMVVVAADDPRGFTWSGETKVRYIPWDEFKTM